ncbi:phage regulatory protein/antirepressor Ant [Metasolibacillus sp.]|uniref:phage regulatory protein/antirepressor Ant n=1 Tax=Metasolibacillus sp. TaxID=2703680 RepID=UPI0025DBF942|nr:phage regulatory protein/antirepressor Ant [Metasolibacillus sp.]MCT6926236.1 phage regulatory protein/antirepressor Ant [Metasolibacillus sp.]MCT6942473.1 phage regulatory protein/antirepressor Ant [Metasolibacillus sp.]
MNHLINTDVQMTSLDIAEIVGKEHKNVMRDIRNEIEDLGAEISQLIFEPSTYTSDRGKKYPCYKFGKDGAMQLALKYDAQTRYKVIKRIEELEGNQQQPQLPTNYKEALLALVVEVEKNEQLELENRMYQQQVADMQPIMTYVDEVLKCTDLLLTSQIAEDYGMSAYALNKLLHEYGIQYKLNKQWLLYSKFKGQGYTKSETKEFQKSDGSTGVNLHTKWTQKGRLFLYETLKAKGVLPTMEQMKLTLIEGNKNLA